jgi:hypothetical protein
VLSGGGLLGVLVRMVLLQSAEVLVGSVLGKRQILSLLAVAKVPCAFAVLVPTNSCYSAPVVLALRRTDGWMSMCSGNAPPSTLAVHRSLLTLLPTKCPSCVDCSPTLVMPVLGGRCLPMLPACLPLPPGCDPRGAACLPLLVPAVADEVPPATLGCILPPEEVADDAPSLSP